MRIFQVEDKSGFLLRSAKGLAWVSGAFGFIMSVLMIASYVQLATADPLNDPALIELRGSYAGDQHNPVLKNQIRALDLMARKAFFVRRWQLRTGGYMLLGAIILFAGSLRIINTVTRRLPRPAEESSPPPGTRRARIPLIATGGCVFAAALVFSVLADRRFTVDYAVLIAKTDWATLPEEVLTNWPTFRGPGGRGVASSENPPTSWDIETGMNILWTAPVPLPGTGSPVIWENLVFLSGSDGKAQQVYCWDALSGEQLWNVAVGPFPGSPTEMPDLSLGAGYAAPTPAVDGERVFALFGSGDIVSIDHGGTLVWGMNLGDVDELYGHASSPLLYDDLLIVQYDHENAAALYAFIARTGAIEWKTPREVYATWSTPVLVPRGGALELIVTASPFMASYNPRTGEELWRIDDMLGEVASSAAYSDGTLVVINQLMSIWGIDLENTELRWEIYDDLPDTASPLAFGELAVIATSFGSVFGLRTDSGEIVWREEFPAGFYASPVKAGDRIYLMDRQGTMHVFAAGEFDFISRASIGEPSDSTPAFKHNRIYIRGERNLYCVGTAGDG